MLSNLLSVSSLKNHTNLFLERLYEKKYYEMSPISLRNVVKRRLKVCFVSFHFSVFRSLYLTLCFVSTATIMFVFVAYITGAVIFLEI